MPIRDGLICAALCLALSACAGPPSAGASGPGPDSGDTAQAWSIGELSFTEAEIGGGRITSFKSNGVWFTRVEREAVASLEAASPRPAPGERRQSVESIRSPESGRVFVWIEGQGWWQSTGDVPCPESGLAVAVGELPAAVRTRLAQGATAAWGVAAIRRTTVPEVGPVYRVELISGGTTDPLRDRWLGLELTPDGQLRRRFIALPRELEPR